MINKPTSLIRDILKQVEEDLGVDHLGEDHLQDPLIQVIHLLDFLTLLIDIFLRHTLIFRFITALMDNICLYLIITIMLTRNLMCTQ